MFDHIDFAVTDFPRSRDFYTNVLAVLGFSPFMEIQREDGREGTGFGSLHGPQFWIGGGQPVTGRLHVAFQAASRDTVDAFYATALSMGGVSHGSPGLRPQYGEPYYAAFVLDPDGHVIEAVCRRAEA
ncbi:MAG: VOC family protein [Lysobacter sp.]|nr:VOC family protein [Lysobacter sp.]